MGGAETGSVRQTQVNAEVRAIEPEFPKKLEPILNTRAPYKVIRGGRGSGKSWGVARALLLHGLNRKLRVVCTRETQRSIRDSVHQLLVDQIVNLGLQGFYKIQQIQITGINGTEFIFAGISDQTISAIKSFERADICWVEEGQVVTENSWQVLLPTIRAEGAEVWVTFNPELDSDPTWKRFVERPPPGTINIEMNWRDNPWFNETLENLRQHDQASLPAYEYNWIWEGKCKPAVTGAIYADQMADLFSDGRVGDFPVSQNLPVFAAWDLGFDNATSIVIFQRQVSAVRIVDYIEERQKLVSWYSGVLREKPYKIKTMFLPHDGRNNHITGFSVERTLQDLQWDTRILPKTDPEDGIRMLRMLFPQLYIDKRCTRLIECLKRYRRIIPATTREPSQPAHDEFSHGADAARYMALAAPLTDNDGTSGFSGTGLQLPPLNYKWAFK